MLETIAVILVIFWALGLVSSHTLGGMIHILLLFALAVVGFRVAQARWLYARKR